jgi:hypothetical protein
VTSAKSGRAERVLLVSLMKSGTHLLQELMTALGYGMHGSGVRVRPGTLPVLDKETRLRIARIAYGKEAVASLEKSDDAQFTEATDRAWEALSWSWEMRLAQPLATWYSRELVDTGFVEQIHERAAGSDYAQTPPRVCWVINQLDITRVDGHFLHEWSETGEPRIIFNYRDPRDMMLSMVNFLSDRTGRGFSDYSDFLVFSEILKSKATLEEQLSYALSDPSFPAQAHPRCMLWLLNHPNVCKTSFEELVGPQGGGSAQAQAGALRRILDFLGITDTEPEDVASRLFNPDVFSFFRGQINAWRDVFTPEHHRLADACFGDVLPLYGYE